MGVDFHMQKEDGTAIQSVYDPENHFLNSLSSISLNDSYFIKYIDQFGDTVFNSLQMQSLLSELKQYASNESDNDARKQINKIINLIEQFIGKCHVYAKFCGD